MLTPLKILRHFKHEKDDFYLHFLKETLCKPKRKPLCIKSGFKILFLIKKELL